MNKGREADLVDTVDWDSGQSGRSSAGMATERVLVVTGHNHKQIIKGLAEEWKMSILDAATELKNLAGSRCVKIERDDNKGLIIMTITNRSE